METFQPVTVAVGAPYSEREFAHAVGLEPWNRVAPPSKKQAAPHGLQAQDATLSL